MKDIFPNVTWALSILLTTAATSASVKRANSALRHVKTVMLYYLHMFIEINSLIMTKYSAGMKPNIQGGCF